MLLIHLILFFLKLNFVFWDFLTSIFTLYAFRIIYAGVNYIFVLENKGVHMSHGAWEKSKCYKNKGNKNIKLTM
jgi:hypothetical protein